MHDLRNFEQREDILSRAGLKPNMSYAQMADITGGITAEELLGATEEIYPNTTSKPA